MTRTANNVAAYDIDPIDGRPVRLASPVAAAAVADYDLSPRQRGEFEALAEAARRNVLAEAGRLKRAATIPCTRCAGSGTFGTHYVNGKPAGRTGVCYRCNGKGRQNGDDQARNHVYDALYYAARR